MLKRYLAVAGTAVSILSTAAFAGGLFNNLPVVGGAAYCALFAGDGVTCQGFVPAGPAALTGAEMIPADTRLSQGSSPQTVDVPSSLFATGAVQVVTTNASVTIANGVSSLVSNQAIATIAAITLPSAPMNNQVVRISNAGSGVLSITAINANTGQSIVQGAAPTALAVETATTAVLSSVAYQYQASNSTWYRIN